MSWFKLFPFLRGKQTFWIFENLTNPNDHMNTLCRVWLKNYTGIAFWQQKNANSTGPMLNPGWGQLRTTTLLDILRIIYIIRPDLFPVHLELSLSAVYNYSTLFTLTILYCTVSTLYCNSICCFKKKIITALLIHFHLP